MGLVDIFAAFRWWAVLMIIGAVATPLTYFLLGRLPDRGYAFTKVVGLLVVSYLFWVLGSLGILDNGFGGIILAFLGLAGMSLWAHSRYRSDDEESQSVLGWLRDNWRYVLIAELVFAGIFILWTWVRAQNPAITGTEKPMEFAFLNSAGRSPDFPALDPWMSGFAISYYYFGYIMTSVIGRLAAVPESVGFNLGVAWLAAASALGAFGLVYNLISSSRLAIHRLALLFAIIAAVALPIAGNLEIALEVLNAKIVRSPEFWEWLDIRDLDGPSEELTSPRYEKTPKWWWWRSSRVIHEYSLAGDVEEGLEPIAEFPGFSFILGDLHPHVLSLPFAFLSLAVALRWWLQPGPESLDIKALIRRGGLRKVVKDLGFKDGPFLLFTILLLGGLSFLNTWDVFIHMFVIIGAIILGRWRQAGAWRGLFLRQAITFALIFVIGSVVLYLPFYLGLRSQAGPPFLLPMIMRPTRLIHFLVIFGMPLVVVVILLLTLTVHYVRTRSRGGPHRNWLQALGLTVAIILSLTALLAIIGVIIATSPDSTATITSLGADLGRDLPGLPADPSLLLRFRWAVAALISLFPAIIGARLPFSALIIFLGTLIFMVAYLLLRILNRNAAPDLDTEEASIPSVLPFVLLLILTATLLVLGPEFVYLKDNFGQRLNTIFKFYYQAWVMFGVAALFGLDYLLRNFRISGIVATLAYVIALSASLLFPFYAVQSRAVEYRGSLASENRQPATLDGLAHLNRYNPDELAAINWLRDTVDGTPVILEAVGGQYTNYGRVSASTGLPTVLGWAGHEAQWRGNTPEPGKRVLAVENIYDGQDWDQASTLLDEYEVTYIFLGSLEKNTYSPRAEEVFDRFLELAYENDSVKIYQWAPSS